MYIEKTLFITLIIANVAQFIILILLGVLVNRRRNRSIKAYQGELEAQKKRDYALYSQEIINRQIKLSALQSQINPHFLYNTLECIRSEAIVYHCPSIAKITKALALFYRYNISNKNYLVTLQEEIANINDYFFIQSYRFDNRFSLQLQWETEIQDASYALLPKLTLQPIVENSIFHGLEEKAGKGTVSLRIATTDRLLLLTVSDDGIGMDVQVLNQIQSNLDSLQLPKEKDSEAKNNGIALSNINQRIKLAFGEEYGLHIYSTKNVGTTIEIILPLTTGKEKV